MFCVSLKYVPEYVLPLFTSVANCLSSVSLEIRYGSLDVPEPVYALATPARHAVIINKQKSALTARRDFHWGGGVFPIEMGIVHNITPNSLTLSKFVRKGYIDIEDGFLCCTED